MSAESNWERKAAIFRCAFFVVVPGSIGIYKKIGIINKDMNYK